MFSYVRVHKKSAIDAAGLLHFYYLANTINIAM